MACTKKGSGEKGSCNPCQWRSVRFSLLFLVSVGAIVGVYQAREHPDVDDDDVSTPSARINLTNIMYSSTRRPSAVFDINDVITHDRWVVLQPWGHVEPSPRAEGDEQDVREQLTCAVVEASVEQGWRPLVLAEHVACCSKPRCVLLHSGKRARLPYELRPFLESLNGSAESNMAAQRNLAFLFAIQHGARFLMDWYLEHPQPADTRSVADYQRRAAQLLQAATLDVSLGLVLERAADAPLFAVSPRPIRRVYNPHAHFGRPDIWAEGFQPPEQRHVSLGLLSSSPRGRLVPRWATEAPPPPRRRASATVNPSPHQRYRVCELRPPSIEKFLHQQTSAGLTMDVAAPAVVIPGDTLAPASAQTSLYSGEALWALALLPGAAEHPVPSHLLRTLWAYPLLANIAASVKVSLSPLLPPERLDNTLQNVTRAESASAELAAAVLRWRCSSRSTLACVTQLGRDLAPLLGHEAAVFLATWANDLRRLRYLEPPVVPLRRGGLRSPCLGHHGLGGLSFQAWPLDSASPLTREEVDRRTRARGRYSEELALLDWIRQLDSSHNNDTDSTAESTAITSTNSTTDVEPPVITELPSLEKFMSAPYSQAKRDAEQSSIQRETVDGMCLGFSDFLPTRPNRAFSTMLLVVSFSAEGGYDLLPMIEIMYRPHFQNILYCGPPHASLDIYTHKFQVAENRTLSYLPASTSGFECLVGAMEMGYHVDDYLLVTSDSLLLPWTMSNLNRSQLWYGSEINQDEVITRTQWRDIDPGGQKLPRVVEAVGQALKFIAHLLGVHEPDHDEHDIEDEMIPDEEGQTPDDSGKDKIKPSPTPHHEEPAEEIPELHLHAEGVTDGSSTNTSSSVYSYETKEEHVSEPVNGTVSLDSADIVHDHVEIKLHDETDGSQTGGSISVDELNSELVMLHNPDTSTTTGHVTDKDIPESIHLIPDIDEEKSETKIPDTHIETFSKEEGVDDFRLPDVDQSNDSDTHVSENDDVILPETFEDDLEIKLQKNSETYDTPSTGGTYSIDDNTDAKTHNEETIINSEIHSFSQSTPSSTDHPAVPEERHSIVDEILEDEEPHNHDNIESHSTIDTDETSPSVGLQDVASENPSNIEDGIVQYILSSTTTASSNSTSDEPTLPPSEIPWPTSNETMDEPQNITAPIEEEIVPKKGHSQELHISSSFDSDGDSGLIVLEEGRVNDKKIPAYHVEPEEQTEIKEKTDLNNDQFNITSFLDIDELTDSSLNPVHDTLSSQTAEEIEKSAENGFAKRKAEDGIESLPKIITKRDIEIEAPLSSYMDRRMDRTFKYIEELFSTVISRLNTTQEIPSFIPNIQNNRLDPREFKHLRCHDTGIPSYNSNTDLCQSLKHFFLHLNELYHRGGDFAPPYTSYPVYHVPASQQKAFYLLANVFLQFGVPDQVAVPLLLRGLAVPGQGLALRRSFFGSDTPATVQPGYPLFEDKAHFLFPVSLQQDLHGDTRFRTVFCLKYLYNMLS